MFSASLSCGIECSHWGHKTWRFLTNGQSFWLFLTTNSHRHARLPGRQARFHFQILRPYVAICRIAAWLIWQAEVHHGHHHHRQGKRLGAFPRLKMQLCKLHHLHPAESCRILQHPATAKSIRRASKLRICDPQTLVFLTAVDIGVPQDNMVSRFKCWGYWAQSYFATTRNDLCQVAFAEDKWTIDWPERFWVDIQPSGRTTLMFDALCLQQNTVTHEVPRLSLSLSLVTNFSEASSNQSPGPPT